MPQYPEKVAGHWWLSARLKGTLFLLGGIVEDRIHGPPGKVGSDTPTSACRAFLHYDSQDGAFIGRCLTYGMSNLSRSFR
jgi:hypothetical protein